MMLCRRQMICFSLRYLFHSLHVKPAKPAYQTGCEPPHHHHQTNSAPTVQTENVTDEKSHLKRADGGCIFMASCAKKVAVFLGLRISYLGAENE